MICYDGRKKVAPEITDNFGELMKGIGYGYSGQVLPIRTVGVQGDNRSYRHLAVIWGKEIALEWDKVYHIGTTVPNKVSGINRIAYLLNRSELDAQIKSFQMYINRDDVELLRELDFVVTGKLNRPPISQTLAVLLPVGIEKKRSVAIRTFITNDYMTGRPAFIGEDISRELIASLVAEIEAKFPEIEFVFYDVTSKPPATVEWQ